jgi:hypothetical protein
MSRYAVWLMPLLVPFLRQAGDVAWPAAARWSFITIVIASSIWSVMAFHPERPQYGPRGPSWIAGWLWTNYPWLDRPLPEVFVERLRPGETRRVVPTMTAGCTKILLMGQGAGVPIWPVPCVPVPVDAECEVDGVLCYADRRGDGYAFSVVPQPSLETYRFDRSSVWTREEAAALRPVFDKLRWRELSVCDTSVSRIERGAFGVGGPRHYCGPDRLLAYFRNGDGAYVRLRLRARMTGALLDASTGQVIQPVGEDLRVGEMHDIAIPSGPESVVLILAESGWP